MKTIEELEQYILQYTGYTGTYPKVIRILPEEFSSLAAELEGDRRFDVLTTKETVKITPENLVYFSYGGPIRFSLIELEKDNGKA